MAKWDIKMAQKKLQKDSSFAHLDKDGDGIVSDEEMLMERRMIEATLELVDGDKNLAAEMLGLTARTLYRRIDEWKAEES